MRVIILPGTQILKVGSRISNCSQFSFSYLKFFGASCRFNRLGATRTKKIQLLGKYDCFFAPLFIYVHYLCHGKVPKVDKGMLDFVEDIFVGVKSH